jgi:dephospho-CoA kinase
MLNPTNSIEALSKLIQTIHQLRAPDGCAWDRAQTHQSLRQYLIEEAYETLDVLDQIHTPEDLKKELVRNAFREELGDVLMQVLLHSEMTREVGAFDIYDVAKALDEKLIRRHPHVFGEDKADSAESAFEKWEKEKAKEKAKILDASILDGVPKGLPALQRAARVLEKVTKVGFQWHDMNGPLEKVDEELNELKVEVRALEKFKQNKKQRDKEAGGQAVTNADDLAEKALRKKVEGELGDLFFTLCNVAYLMKVSPEDSLRGTMSRFEKRFRHVETRLKENGKTPEQSDLKEMDQFWDEAKKIERAEVWGLTGGIASGKTTAGKIFAELGIPVVDADLIARELSLERGAAHAEIIKRFGTADRPKLREIIFSDPAAKKDLEAILHPMIQAESQKRIQKLAQTHDLIIYEATLLVETGRYRYMAGLIVVDSPEERRLDHLMTRDKIAKPLAEKIIHAQASQLSNEDRRKHANLILDNSGDLPALRDQISKWLSDRI